MVECNAMSHDLTMLFNNRLQKTQFMRFIGPQRFLQGFEVYLRAQCRRHNRDVLQCSMIIFCIWISIRRYNRDNVYIENIVAKENEI